MKLVTYRASVMSEARLGVCALGLVIDVFQLGQRFGQALPATMLELIDLARWV